MKRLLLSTFLASLSIAAQAAPAPTTSTSDDFFFKPYIGADYDQLHANYSNGNDSVLEKNLNGGDIHVGVQVHKYLGFELGYLDTARGTKDNVLNTGTIYLTSHN